MSKNRYGSIAIALLIGILIISVCSSISMSMATMCIGTNSDLNIETLKTEINLLLESYVSQFKSTGEINGAISFDENLNESKNLDSNNTKYVIEYEIATNETSENLNLVFKEIYSDEILDTRTARRFINYEQK